MTSKGPGWFCRATMNWRAGDPCRTWPHRSTTTFPSRPAGGRPSCPSSASATRNCPLKVRPCFTTYSFCLKRDCRILNDTNLTKKILFHVPEKTVNRLSFPAPGAQKRPTSYAPVNVYARPCAKMECSTIQKLSYRPTEVRPRWIPPWAIRQYSAPCAAMEGNTIYRASYLAPGEECDDGGTDPNACCEGKISTWSWILQNALSFAWASSLATDEGFDDGRLKDKYYNGKIRNRVFLCYTIFSIFIIWFRRVISMWKKRSSPYRNSVQSLHILAVGMVYLVFFYVRRMLHICVEEVKWYFK